MEGDQQCFRDDNLLGRGVLMRERVVAIVSGGMDSVTMLKMLVDEGKDVFVLNFSYGSKHNQKERSALVQICSRLQLEMYVYDLPVDIMMLSPVVLNSLRTFLFQICLNLVTMFQKVTTKKRI